MSYEKQDFTDNTVLTAAQLNHMEEGIAAAEELAGKAGTALTIGTVTTGDKAAASIADGKLNLTLPRGEKGDSGTSASALTPEQFGAVGDGVTNDTEALVAAMTAASEKKQPLEMTPGATYRYTEVLNPKDNLTIHGNGASLLSDIQWAKQAQDRPGIFVVGSKTDLVQHIRIEGLTFRAADTCQTNTMLRFQCSRDVQVKDCVFDCDINTQNRGCMDLYGVNHDFLFENIVFRQLSACKEGGIWVRNWAGDYGSSNIRFLHCDFYKAGGDEVLAVWGWGGVVKDVLISGCNFYEVDDEKYRARGFYPAWGITLGQTGKRCDVRMENCVVRMNRCETLFRMLGDGTHAVVDNCDLYSEQPADMEEHDWHKGAYPILARGNNKADGSTLFSNCRIHLRGDDGRRICYQVSALRDNYFDVECGYGPSSTREVIGNVFQGSLKGVIWDCNVFKDNVVELTNSGGAWMSGAAEVIGNQFTMNITADGQGAAVFHNNWHSGSILNNKLDLTYAKECDMRQYEMSGGPQYVQNNIINIKGARYTHLQSAISGLIYRKNNFFNNVPEKLFECTGVTFDEETRTEQYKKHTRLGVIISPENCTDPVVYTWENADGVLDVGEYGAYRPLKDGTASVTVSCGMFSASQKIAVKLTPVPCEGLKLSRVTAKCGKGMSTYLKAFPQPYWTTDDVVWTSDAEDVVTVTQDGVVSALKTGTANITVTCGSFTVTCAVTAVEASELPTYTEGEWALDDTVAYVPMPNLEAEHTLYAAFDVDTNCVDAGKEFPLISSLLSGQTGQEAIKLAFGADGDSYKTVRWYTTDATSDEKGNTTLYRVTYVNDGFKEDEPASTHFLYLKSGVANGSGAVIWASQTSTVKAAPNSGILSFNVQTSADDTPITSFTSGAALAAALASGSVHATKATGFKLKELILFTNASYTTLDDIKKYRENAEIDLRFDADGHPLNAGTAGDFVIAGGGGEIVPVSSVTLNKNTLSLTKGGTDTLAASVLPANAAEKTVNWSVSPEGVVTLSGTTGSSVTVTAAAAGECTITAAAGDKTVTCAVTVAADSSGDSDPVPVFSLPETTFVPSEQKVVDTGIKLFESADGAKDYTIIISQRPNSPDTSTSHCLLHCMEETSPNPGLSLSHGKSAYAISAFGRRADQLLSESIGFNTNTVVFAIRVSAKQVWAKAYAGNNGVFIGSKGWVGLYSDYAAVNKTLLIGGYQTSDGVKGHFWDGTVNWCKIYDKLLDETVIDSIMTGQTS